MLHILLVAAARLDVLEELVRRTAESQHFSAHYALTSTAGAEPAEIRIDYVAPAKVRVDLAKGAKTTAMWCVDGVLAMVTDEGEAPLAGRVDCAQVYAELDGLEAALAKAFPGAPPRGELGAAVGMRWAFDEQAQKANYTIEAQISAGSRTPLGWLETLEQKGVTPTVEGEQLRYSTDGHFEIAINKLTGFFERFDGRSPTGEMHLKLAALELSKPPEPARFEIAAGAAGARDISAELRRSVVRVAELGLRRRMYESIAGSQDAAWDDARSASAAALLRAFHERTVPATLAPFLERSVKLCAGVSDRLAELKAKGKSPEEVEAARLKELGFLDKQLAELEDGLRSRTIAPPGAEKLARTEALLALERQVLLAVFDERVRQRVRADFDAAVAAKLR